MPRLYAEAGNELQRVLSTRLLVVSEPRGSQSTFQQQQEPKHAKPNRSVFTLVEGELSKRVPHSSRFEEFGPGFQESRDLLIASLSACMALAELLSAFTR